VPLLRQYASRRGLNDSRGIQVPLVAMIPYLPENGRATCRFTKEAVRRAAKATVQTITTTGRCVTVLVFDDATRRRGIA
jgi:hypothetical protein